MKKHLFASFVIVALFGVITSTVASYFIYDHTVKTATERQTESIGKSLVTIIENAESGIKRLPQCQQINLNSQNACQHRLINLLRRVVNAGVDLIVVNQYGQVVAGQLPTWLSKINLSPLTDGQSLTGTANNVVYAIVPVTSQIYQPQNSSLTPAVFMTAPFSPIKNEGLLLFVFSLISVIVALILALYLSTRFSLPLKKAVQATDSLAKGNLGLRLEVNPKEIDEFKQLYLSINKLAESLQQARELDRAFFMSISHDLKTPLTSISGYAEAISDGTVTPLKAAVIIKEQASKLNHMVQDILDLGKLESKQLTVKLRSVKLQDELEDIFLSIKPMFDEAKLNLTFENKISQATAVVADSERLRQILINLIENAYKFARSCVKLTTTEDGSHVFISVQDDGPGIPPGDFEKIFTRFYSRELPTQRSAGTGLGLAIVKELSSLLGYEVMASNLNNETEQGSVFTLKIPKLELQS